MNEDISRVRAELKAGNEPGVGHPSKDPSGRMSTQNIVLTALRNQGKEKHFERMYSFIHKTLESNKVRCLREGNTLFLVTIKGNNVCYVHMVNADSQIKTLKNILGFFSAMKKANYKEVHFDTVKYPLIVFLKNKGYQIQELGNNTYVVQL